MSWTADRFALASHYELLIEDEVRFHLASRPGLAALLVEAADEIRRRFGQPKLSLRASRCDEDRLVIIVGTDLEVDEAEARFAQFRSAWWRVKIIAEDRTTVKLRFAHEGDLVDDLSSLDIHPADAVGVWYDLERALAGKHPFGGHVAEIYAYRLVPPALRQRESSEEQARIAGKSMTAILRQFMRLHEAAVGIVERRGELRRINPSVEEFPPFDWRVQLRVEPLKAPAAAAEIHVIRAAIAGLQGSAEILDTMLDELATFRARARLAAEARPSVADDDLPPDAATGLYLDRPFDVADLEWIKMAWDAFLGCNSRAQRPAQLMNVFASIWRDPRSTAEFLRVMNTIVLPLCRRLRLKEQPHLATMGAASE